MGRSRESEGAAIGGSTELGSDRGVFDVDIYIVP